MSWGQEGALCSGPQVIMRWGSFQGEEEVGREGKPMACKARRGILRNLTKGLCLPYSHHSPQPWAFPKAETRRTHVNSSQSSDH